jgi:DTW domain-containing protein YfiP
MSSNTKPNTNNNNNNNKQDLTYRYLNLSQVTTKRTRAEDRLPGLSSLDPLFARLPTLNGNNSTLDRTCPKCGDEGKNNNRIYCYQCLVPVGGLVLPQVRLPIKLDIIRHPGEKKTKSTALHAPVLCGEDEVRCVEVPEIDSLGTFDPETTILLFPSNDSVIISELEHLEKINRVVVVDSTWQQARSVLNVPQLKSLRKIRLANNYQTSFWRYQLHGEDHLATIEAIYFFYREWVMAINNIGLLPTTTTKSSANITNSSSSNNNITPAKYDINQLDNLLYIFLGMLRVIEASKEAKNNTKPITTSSTTDNEDNNNNNDDDGNKS